MRTLSFFALAASFVLIAASCGGTGGADVPGGGTDTGPGAGGSSAGGSTGKGGSTSGSGGAKAGSGGSGTAGSGVVGGSGGSSAGSGGAPAGGKSGASGASSGSGGAKAGSGGSGTAGQSTGGSAPTTVCKANDECAGNPTAKICDVTTGRCVECIPSNDSCPSGQYCNAATKTCASGCKADTDCPTTAAHCDPATNQCKECFFDAQCGAAEVCSKGKCATGCSASKPCANATEQCCNGSCHDVSSDVDNCNACGTVCPTPANATATCTNGACGSGACAAGFADCNQDPSDGCEVNTALQGACVCTPGDSKPCYDGPGGTENVGLCKGGSQFCAPNGLGWIPGCVGQVLPHSEQCGDGLDHNCNGVPNDVPDVDGDGWTLCDGDCCEDTTQCGNPKAVNPGAFEVAGDQIDDDCDGNLNVPDCTSTQKLTGVTPLDMAAAMELCQQTTANPPLSQKRWGVISAEFLLADGSAPGGAMNDIQNKQAAVLADYGPATTPRKGATIAGISSGVMRDADDAGAAGPSTGLSSSSNPPNAYLAQHGGNLPASAGCSGGCQAGSGAYDSVLLRLKIRVPTNAPSFSYDFRFFTYEYYVYQCTPYNDFYLAMLQSGAPGIPADKNISFDSKNNPISVNNGFFEVCDPNGGAGCNACPYGTGDLAGTQLESEGGATKWLTTTAPVVPGEVITLDLMVFDVSDHILDSLSLLDNFQWSVMPSGPPTTNPAQ